MEKSQINARLIALYFFQYSILIPVMHYIDSTLVVMVVSLFLIALLFIYNHSLVVNKKNILFYFLMILLVVFKVSIGHCSIGSLAWIIVFTMPTLCFFLYPIDYHTVIKELITLSRIAFLLLFWNPFSSSYSYMRFGYGMVPIVYMAYVDFFYFKTGNESIEKHAKYYKAYDILVFFLGIVEILIYGARGGLIAIALFLVLDRLLINKRRVLMNAFYVVVSAVLLWNIPRILSLMVNLSNSLGVFSYSLMKFQRQLEDGIVSGDSGRSVLYQNSFRSIIESPFLGGNIQLSEEGGEYVHNIFLQVGQDLGIIILGLLVLYLIYILYHMGSSKNIMDERLILLVFFSSSIGRLMFSSTFWRRPEFWMLLFFSLALSMNRRVNKEEGRVDYLSKEVKL